MRGWVIGLAVVCSLVLAGCGGVDEQALSKQIMDSMQEEFTTNRDLPPLQVQNVELVHADGNRYEGIATVRSLKGTVRRVPVHVTADDDGRGLWQIDQGALMWAQLERT